MKEENKYVTILKVLLFVSLVSLLTSAVVNLVICCLPHFAVYYDFIPVFFDNQVVMPAIFVAILLCFVVIYGLVLLSVRRIHIPLITAFAISLLTCFASLILFVTTIVTSLDTYYQSDYFYSVFTTLLAMYGTGFAISLLVTLLHFGDFLAFLRELKSKRIKSN